VTPERAPLLIDAVMPESDAAVAAHAIVRKEPSATYRAAVELDFLSVRTPLLDAAMWARGVPERLGRRPSVPPARLVLSQGDPLPGWLVLGEQEDHELVFGAIGKFWQPAIEWRDVARDQFEAFREPGWGKIAAAFVVTPYGQASSLLTYECRTATTDPASRRRFLRYWRLVRPFVAHILRATVHTIREHAEHGDG
jgi:hypothetical protein